MNKKYKKCLVILTLLGIYVLPLIGFGQSNDKNIAFLYSFDFKYHTNRPDIIKRDYIIVNKSKDTTYTQFYNQMIRDSIYSIRKMSGQERFDNKVNNIAPHIIKIIKNKITFTAQIGNDYFEYNEILDLDWKLKDSIKQINSYACRLATTNYGGRKWNAWFTQEIPVNIGPYKFKGLPGCIVQISDQDNIFSYSLVRFKEKKEIRLDHFPSVKNESIEITTRKKFNIHFQALRALSFEERMAYYRKSEPGMIKIISSNEDSDVNFNNKSLDAMDKYEFIEIDHIE